MLAYGATVPGGIFMPIFVLGSVIGAIAGIVMIHAGIIPASCYLNIIAISMAAYFGAAEGVPFSAILLVTEMVGTIPDDAAHLCRLLHQHAARRPAIDL